MGTFGKNINFQSNSLKQNSNNNKKTTKFMIDDIYSYMSNLSIYGKINQISLKIETKNENDKIDITNIIEKIDLKIKDIDDKYNLDFQNDKNIWFKNYLTSYIANSIYYKLTFDEKYASKINSYDINAIINEVELNIKNFIEESNKIKKSKYLKPDIDNQLNWNIFIETETFKLSQKIENIKNYIGKENNITIKKNVVNLFYNEEKRFINNEIIDLIMETTLEEYIKDDKYIKFCQWVNDNELNLSKQEKHEFNTKFVNSKINLLKFNLFKNYFYFISEEILNEYKKAIIKTHEHIEKLPKDKKEETIFKFNKSGGLPINKFKLSAIQNFNQLKQTINKYKK